MNHSDGFDNILDEALQEYREAEPLAGIEDRVLRRLRRDVARRPAFGRQWRVATAALAMIAILIWAGVRFGYPHRSSPPPLVRQRMPAIPVSPEITQLRGRENHISPGPSVHSRAVTVVARQAAQLANATPAPVREQFPMPAPLDREERALLALARTDPEALRPLAQDGNNVVEIAPITIQPLEHGDTEGED